MEFILITTFFYLFGGALGAYPPHLPIGHGTIGQLYTVLNTDEPFWLIRRTYTIYGHSCVYSKKVFLNNTAYEFFQVYMNNGTMERKHLYARLFMKQGDGSAMEVRAKKEVTSGTVYDLVIWDEQKKCGILYFNDSQGLQQCELYAWNSKAGEALTQCTSTYNQYCNTYTHTEQTVYTNECKEDPGC